MEPQILSKEKEELDKLYSEIEYELKRIIGDEVLESHDMKVPENISKMAKIIHYLTYQLSKVNVNEDNIDSINFYLKTTLETLKEK